MRAQGLQVCATRDEGELVPGLRQAGAEVAADAATAHDGDAHALMLPVACPAVF